MTKSYIHLTAIAFLSVCVVGQLLVAQDVPPVIQPAESAQEQQQAAGTPENGPVLRAVEHIPVAGVASQVVELDHSRQTSPGTNPSTPNQGDPVTALATRLPEKTQLPLIVPADQKSIATGSLPAVQPAMEWKDTTSKPNGLAPAVIRAIPSSREETNQASVQLVTEHRPSGKPLPMTFSPPNTMNVVPQTGRQDKGSTPASQVNREVVAEQSARPTELVPHVARLPERDLPPIVGTPQFEDVVAPAKMDPPQPSAVRNAPITVNRGVRPKSHRNQEPGLPMRNRFARIRQRDSRTADKLNGTQVVPDANQIPIIQRPTGPRVSDATAPSFDPPPPAEIGSRLDPWETETRTYEKKFLTRRMGELPTANRKSADSNPDQVSTIGAAYGEPGFGRQDGETGGKRRLGLLSGSNAKNNPTRLASYFDDDPVELGKDLGKYNGITEIQMNGSSAPMEGCTCGGCSSGSCDSPRCQYDVNSVTDAFQCCGFIGRARRIITMDGMYWFVDTDNVIGSTFFGLPDYDGSLGGRFGFTDKQGVRGQEFIYTGFETWSVSETFNAFAPGLSANFIFVSPSYAAAAAPFFDAITQSQFGKARLHSFELNRTWWGWDVVKTQIGLRYIYYSEDYQLFSDDGFSTSNYFIDAENNLITPQAGIELFYDVGRRIAFTFAGKIGGGLNVHRTAISAETNGFQFLNNDSDSADFTWNFEVGFSANWKLGPGSRLVAGYDILGMLEVSTPETNFTGLLVPLAGSETNSRGDVFAHGFSFGIEIYR